MYPMRFIETDGKRSGCKIPLRSALRGDAPLIINQAIRSSKHVPERANEGGLSDAQYQAYRPKVGPGCKLSGCTSKSIVEIGLCQSASSSVRSQ